MESYEMSDSEKILVEMMKWLAFSWLGGEGELSWGMTNVNKHFRVRQIFPNASELNNNQSSPFTPNSLQDAFVNKYSNWIRIFGVAAVGEKTSRKNSQFKQNSRN